MMNILRAPCFLFLCAMLLLPIALPGVAQDLLPTEPRAFHRWLVDSRIAMAKARVITGATPEARLQYKGNMEDSNVLLLYACGYAGEWSKYYHDADLLQKSTLLLDDLSTLYLDPAWRAKSCAGLDPFFDLHTFSLAVYLWQETGAVAKEKTVRWISAVRAMADNALAMNTGPLAGDYANPEFYMLSGLAVTAKLTGEERYRREAAECLRRFADDFYPDGGMSYFMDSNPQIGYQGMITSSTALYYEMTGDPLAKEMLARIARYYCQSLHPLGFQPPYESPVLKQNWNYPFFNPADVRLAAVMSEDPEASWMAGVVEQRYREGLQGRWPSFLSGKYKEAYWQNYHSAKSS
ncbi:MAG TPA: hypothetical protein VGM23_05010, partial [Armatimonadota bacterium]